MTYWTTDVCVVIGDVADASCEITGVTFVVLAGEDDGASLTDSDSGHASFGVAILPVECV